MYPNAGLQMPELHSVFQEVDENNKDYVCRDFQRNACQRGTGCRFQHLTEERAEHPSSLMFCHDFQNVSCRRPNCKFVHCTKQEEETFRATGRLPDTVLPVCKDFLKNECRRAGRCRFRHVPAYEREVKRRAIESARCQIMEEEKALLLLKIEELKKQVVDLTATNEFLLDQNAQLRISKQTLVSPISQQLIPATQLAPVAQLAPVSPATSLPQTIITSTALISYPVMTQSLRPVIPHSLG